MITLRSFSTVFSRPTACQDSRPGGRRMMPRLTVGRLMMAVAAIGAAMWFLGVIYNICDNLLNERFCVSTSPIRKVWSVGPSPSVMVDLFEGSITVTPGADGEIAVDVEASVDTKKSRADAERAAKTLHWGFHRWGNSIRVTARGLSEVGINNSIGVRLSVPPGVNLDLRTERGNIYVGEDYPKGTRVQMPVSAASIRATNASDYRLGYAQGSIVVVALAPLPIAGSSPKPTLIQLDAPGRIDIKADLAVVAARAWHGDPPMSTRKAYEVAGEEGTITFEGSLAEGIHSFHAAHRISMQIRDELSLHIEAEAGAGPIMGDLLPEEIEPTDGKALWTGSLGPKGGRSLLIRTDQGPITLLRAKSGQP